MYGAVWESSPDVFFFPDLIYSPSVYRDPVFGINTNHKRARN